MPKRHSSIHRATFHVSQLEARRLFSGYALTHVANFDSGNNGDQPVTSVIDASGNLFGVTTYGGAYGYGDVFELPAGSSTISIVASFNSANGASPSNLIIDSAGNLFGTTSIGGASNNGTVFEIANGTGSITTLCSLDGMTSGSSPKGICVDAQGNIFGTALNGGTYNDGTFFEMPAGSSTLQVLNTFSGSDGIHPDFVIADTDGTIYGTCSTDSATSLGYGTLFKYRAGTFNPWINLANLTLRSGAKEPIALGLDRNHNIFLLTAATPYTGGSQGEISYIFAGTTTSVTWGSFFGSNGITPTSFHVDADGNIFGTTSSSSSGLPTVFRQLRTSDGNPITIATIPNSDGNLPAGLSVDPSGNLYGVLTNGPFNTGGAVFKVDLGTATPTLSTAATFQPPGAMLTSTIPLSHDAAGDVFGSTFFTNGSIGQSLYEIPAGTSAPVTRYTASDGGIAGVAVDDAGNIFFATGPDASGPGQILELPAGASTPQVLATLPTSQDVTAFTRDAAGNLFGAMVTSPSATRTLFELPVGQNSIVMLTTFANGHSTSPEQLVVDGNGNLFGCGFIDSSHGSSTIYELPAGASTINVLSTFADSGNVPTSLALDSSGNLFGTIGLARYSNTGSVFEIAKGSSTLTTIASFDANTGGPVGLQVDQFGNLFGAATYGGPDHNGSIFEIAAGSSAIQTIFNFSTISVDYANEVTLLPSGTLYATYITEPGTRYGGVFAISPMSNSIIGSNAITLGRDPDQNRIDWSSDTAVGQVAINDASGLTIFGNDARDVITLDYSRGNPLPSNLHLNGQFLITGLAGANPLAGTTLDIGNSTVYLNDGGATSDLIPAIRTALAAGYSGGTWNGSATASTSVIRSQAASDDTQKMSGIGYVDSATGLIANQPANTIELKYVLFGDTGLLGTTGPVGFTDFMRMTQHYTMTNTTWSQGDFNYDGTVDAADFALLQPNYGQTLQPPPPPQTPAPAPTVPPMDPVVATPTDDAKKSKNDSGKTKKPAPRPAKKASPLPAKAQNPKIKSGK